MKIRNLKLGDIAGISKYKNIFAKSYVPNWSEEVFVITKVKNTFRGHMLLAILKAKKLLKRFTRKNCKKIKQINKKIKKSLELKK